MSDFKLPPTNLNYDQICRACLSKGELQSLYTKINSIKLVDMLTECTPIQVSDEDVLPKQMCLDCVNRLNEAYVFRQQCEKSNAALKLYTKGLKFEPKIILDTFETEKKSTSRKQNTIEDTNLTFEPDLPESENKKIAFQCEICSKEFISTDELAQHMIIQNDHSDNKKMVKMQYGQKFRRQNNEKNNRVTCEVCSKKITTIHLMGHMRTHTNEKLFNCEFCGKNFNWKDSLRRHIARHKALNKNHQCEICPKSFIGANELAYHINSNHPLDDSVIDTAVESKNEVANVEHKNDLNKINMDEAVPYCEICKKKFSSKGALKVHKLTHGPKTFVCDECDKKFSTSTALKLHKRVHTGEKPYSCEFCNRRFSHSNAYRAHYRLHTGERPYVCKVCKATFTQGAHLRRHVVIHSSEKLFLCNVCGASFDLNFKLKVHMRLHTGETPYLCSICGKAYRKSSSLLKHRKSKIHVNVNPEM